MGYIIKIIGSLIYIVFMIFKIIGSLIYIIFMIFAIILLIYINIAIIYPALFYKIPTFQSLNFTEFEYNRHWGYYCYKVSKGKGVTAYKSELRHNEGIYKLLYTMPTQQECYKQLNELEEKNIKIWYRKIDDTFNLQGVKVYFEIYQMTANDKIIVSYQESVNMKKRDRVDSLFIIVIMHVCYIYLYLKKKERDRIKKMNNDFRRYGL